MPLRDYIEVQYRHKGNFGEARNARGDKMFICAGDDGEAFGFA